MSSMLDWTVTPPGLSEHRLVREGRPVYYWTGGAAGPTVVLLHGAWMDHRMFNAQIPMLTHRHRVLVWDAAGHGRSQPMAPTPPRIDDYVSDLLAILDREQIDRATLIGQSMGGYIAQHLIRRHPERVGALVVIGSTPIASPVSRTDVLTLNLVARSFGLWPSGYLRRSVAQATAVTQQVQAYAADAMRVLDRRTLVRIYLAVASAVRRAGFDDCHIDVPFLLTHGDQDRTGNIAKDGPRWAASDPRIDYLVIPEAGHNANQDNPKAFNEALQQFLDRVPRTPKNSLDGQ